MFYKNSSPDAENYSPKLRRNLSAGGVGGGFGNYSEKKRLMCDRSAYMSFLESQLDTINNACLTVRGYENRLKDLEDSIFVVNHKIEILTKTYKEKIRENFADRISSTSSSSPASSKNLKNQKEISKIEILNFIDEKFQKFERKFDEKFENLKSRVKNDVQILAEKVDEIETEVVEKLTNLKDVQRALRSSIENLNEKEKENGDNFLQDEIRQIKNRYDNLMREMIENQQKIYKILEKQILKQAKEFTTDDDVSVIKPRVRSPASRIAFNTSSPRFKYENGKKTARQGRSRSLSEKRRSELKNLENEFEKLNQKLSNLRENKKKVFLTNRKKHGPPNC